MELLVAACPSFKEAWTAYASEPDFDPALVHVHLGEFAEHVIELLRHGDSPELEPVFDIIERLFSEGDADVQEAATLGLLDGLQSAAVTAGVSPARFLELLRPVTRQRWDELERFWAGQLSYVGRGGQRSGEE